MGVGKNMLHRAVSLRQHGFLVLTTRHTHCTETSRLGLEAYSSDVVKLLSILQYVQCERIGVLVLSIGSFFVKSKLTMPKRWSPVEVSCWRWLCDAERIRKHLTQDPRLPRGVVHSSGRRPVSGREESRCVPTPRLRRDARRPRSQHWPLSSATTRSQSAWDAPPARLRVEFVSLNILCCGRRNNFIAASILSALWHITLRM